MSKKAKELLQMDLYGLLGIDSSATEKQIKKAYRKKVLTCHPDKNPDNPKAAELFHQLSEALEVLTDAASKAAYDKICEAKKREAKRDRELDERRKKFKLDWEAKERQAEAEKEEAEFNRKREAEIIRLREETERMLEEQRQKEAQRVQRIWHQAASEVKGSTSTTNLAENPVLKLRWKCKKGDETNGGYSQDMLFKRLNTFGGVLTVVVSKEKRGLALVEFANVQAAERIFNYEKGLNENPLRISWVKGQPTANPPSSSSSSSLSSQGVTINDEDYESLVLMKLRQAAERQKRTQKEEGSASSCTFPCFASVQPKDPSSSSQGVTISHEDYESLVLMKLRQAAERQKQTQQMQKEDKEEGSASSSSFPSFASVGEVPVQRKKPPSPSQRDRESLADMEVRQAAERRRLIEKMQMEDDEEEASPN